MPTLTNTEKKVIALIQGDIAITQRPYRLLAEKAGMSEARFLEVLEDLNRRGIIRRFGATLRHQKSGFKANAMVAWRVPEDRMETVGATMAGFDQVSHCYRRDPKPEWPYNLYTMVHAHDRNACIATARKMAAAAGVDDYTLLFSTRELKKTSMQYFGENSGTGE
jgi:DNA-binding Lrp family transcriptional regulator